MAKRLWIAAGNSSRAAGTEVVSHRAAIRSLQLDRRSTAAALEIGRLKQHSYLATAGCAQRQFLCEERSAVSCSLFYAPRVPSLVSIDGRIRPTSQAQVSALDRGFLFGDSVYETLRTYDGAPFELAAHLARLRRSAQGLKLPIPVSDGEIGARLVRLLRASRLSEAILRVVVTRGPGKIDLDPAQGRRPTLLLYARPLLLLPAEAYSVGVAVALIPARRAEVGGSDPTLKTGNYLANLLALGEARSRPSSRPIQEALMVAADGTVTEGTSSNFFVVQGRTLVTPPLGVVLAGVTRARVIDLARAAGLTVIERSMKPAELHRADELFLTSTLREILPVIEAGDGEIVAAGKPGAITLRLLEDYRAGTQPAPKPADRR